MLQPEVKAGFERPEYQYEHEKSPGVARYVSELEQLGFKRLGVRFELGGSGSTTRDLELVLADEHCFATIGKNFGKEYVYLLTVFTDGSVVISWFNSNNDELRSDVFVHQNVSGTAVNDLLSAHRAEVARQRARGRTPCPDMSKEGRVDATRIYYENPHNQLRQNLRRMLTEGMSTYLASMVVIIWAFTAAGRMIPSEAVQVVGPAGLLTIGLRWFADRPVGGLTRTLNRKSRLTRILVYGVGAASMLGAGLMFGLGAR